MDGVAAAAATAAADDVLTHEIQQTNIYDAIKFKIRLRGSFP